MFECGRGGRGSDNSLPLQPRVSVKGTEVILTKEVDDSERGGKPVCSKYKLKGMSLKEKC